MDGPRVGYGYSTGAKEALAVAVAQHVLFRKIHVAFALCKVAILAFDAAITFKVIAFKMDADGEALARFPASHGGEGSVLGHGAE